MKVKYLSYAQAKAVCSDHQYLKGAPYAKNDPGGDVIQQIIIAPYSRILQWQFLQSVLRGMPYQDALRINVNGRYDVLVLPARNNPRDIQSKSLRDYMAEYNITYNQDQYSCLRAL